ncbi:MAG TPA: Gfo/Idh/MocA family oxidoreductase [Sulfolobales archaeon]|nr:Gfo/Idh/MocA family oxidoreductase [Sulfolobales archaeon]
MRIGLIVVGAGRMGSIHAENIKRLGSAELIAIVDPDEGRARALSERLHVPYYTDLGEAVKIHRDRVHGLVIASSTSAHLDNARVAGDLGLSIFIEKPLAPSLDECREIVGIVRRRNMLAQVGYQRRFDKGYQEIKRILDTNGLGRLFIAKFIARDPMPEPGIGIGKLYLGAIFDDMVTHEFDLVSWFFGYPPERVNAIASSLCLGGGDYDSALVSISYKDGLLVDIEVTRCSAYGYDLRLEILGSEGLARLENVPENQVYIYSRGNTARLPKLPWFAERFREAYYREIEGFVEAIARGEKPVPNEEDGLRACVLAEASKRSAMSRMPVTISEILDSS